MQSALAKTFELSDPIDYEPAPSRSMKARAEAAGIDVWRYTLDLLCRGDGDTLLLFPFENYSGGDLEVVREMLLAENTVCGLGDAGAHVATICDASYPTYLISHWARDRTRGEGLPLEFLVRKQTLETARTYGLDDRGVIAPGYKADFNIVDFGALGLTMPKVAHDLPAGGRRLVQYSRGYRHTFVSGTEVARDGEATGAMPGKLLRGAQTLGNGNAN
jgi:N-acyl-D-aspartate/D-glutamate deacylase